jgi:hypothetical protein
MAAPDSLALAASAAAAGLPSVLVGGNAVNLYAYRRTTFDVDLLIREADAARWRSFLEEHGFAVFHATSNFIRMRFAADPAGALPIDLMLADEETFRKIHETRRPFEISKGVEVAIPDPLHLIAMKLHALRSPHRVECGVDLPDVVHLIRATKIDVQSAEFTALLDRYATDTIKSRLLSEFRPAAGE